MPLSHLHRFAIAQSKPDFSKSVIFWLGCSLFFAAYYGGCALTQAFASEYVAQDDAREYVFWMQRFVDAELFPNDLTANYFQSITPLGYATLYKVMATIGITPLFLSKILPICLGIVTTIYTFFLSLRIFPVAITAFFSTLILNQSLWFASDIASATPRSFIYPLLPAFLYYLFTESRLALAIVMVLQALFYPLLIFLYSGILIIRWRTKVWQLALTLGLVIIAMSPYIISASEYGPVVSYTQAWHMPEHWREGRHHFFDPNPWQFWLIGQHSGILPAVMPPLIWISLLFPWLKQNPRKFPLIRLLKSQDMYLFWQMFMIAIALYFAAHLFFLKLFFPTRHTIHLFRLIMSLTAGITLTILGDWSISTTKNIRKINLQKFALSLITLSIFTILFLYPNFLKSYPKSEYRIGRHPSLYQYLQQQPKDTLTATLSNEADNLPTFSQRAILVGREYALPFHLGYYSQIRQRTIDLITAQYHVNLQPAKNLIQKYGIDFWLIEKDSLQPNYLTRKTWLKSFQPAFNQAVDSLQKSEMSAVIKATNQCTVWQNQQFWLLKTDCILNQ